MIFVVSGAPRTGTSLMMQMLVAGGIPAWTDGERTADPSNPRGYFEHEGIKRLRDEPRVLAGADGHAVKVVHAQLEYLPVQQPVSAGGTVDPPKYAVLFMHRAMTEVVASQQAMLARQGRPIPSGVSAERIAAVLEDQVQRARLKVESRRDAVVMDIEHRRLVAKPGEVVNQIIAFVHEHAGLGLDAQDMVSVVDESLYRERA